MPEQPDQTPDVDALVERLKQRVEERRSSGEYPPGLEEELDQHFERAVAASFRTRPNLRDLLIRLRQAGEAVPEPVSTRSDLPLGSQVHRVINKVVQRHTDAIREHLAAVTAANVDLLEAVIDQELADLAARVDLLLDRLSAFERLPPEPDAATRALAARVERLEARLTAVAADRAGD